MHHGGAVCSRDRYLAECGVAGVTGDAVSSDCDDTRVFAYLPLAILQFARTHARTHLQLQLGNMPTNPE